MSERDSLLASVASTIRTYRQGELPVPSSAHVGRWLDQFTPANQLPFLREFDHVMKQTFLTQATVVNFLSNLVTNPKLVGADPKAYWSRANLLSIQKKGQSQKAMVALFGEALAAKCGLNIAQCGSPDGPFIYLDDILFTGGRIAADLSAWVAGAAPAKANVEVILMAFHSSGHYFITQHRLKNAVAKSGKDIRLRFWRLVELENQRNRRNDSTVLWPAAIPADPEVQAYVAGEQQYPLQLRLPGGALGPFSSEVGRQVLEHEFLVAGVKIRSKSKNPNDFVRPLGNSGFGVGFGSMLATYRNCPNNCPLAMWWGDPEAKEGALHWYPLLSRKTYSSAENVFNGFDDL